ncbi:hypothetical protein DICSQDRAFT_104652 [Dichomitus squalens LYAD-421 SS1]|uniref:UBC core domain-containing protein n=1 Tax=Dichomitus squalens (strain LYAD-421) TaxID=732165 RepID=R7T2Y9_DICSQ|nr:uncharacterized protein DICSQDRAFT_104652 [Dichomitus squalens LYAD-421 SS1]EJF62287.1 hypothetical protein DICSQDRAFT_104652 [Dichomitus squalens LYAD-421 SS1]
MAPSNQRRAAAKFYQEDIVQRKDDPKAYGVVLRCWQDAEDIPPPADSADPLMRPLVQGEVGVSYFPRPVREIISEDKLALVDRMYQPGDLLKRSVDDVRSGIVTHTTVKGRLDHAISGEAIPGWKTMDEIETAVEVDMGDYVVYNDWVGQVVEMFDEAWVEVSGGTLVRLPELSARLAVGEKGPDILPQPMSTVQGIFGFLLGSTRPSSSDTVISVKHTVLAVAWLAINQALSPAEAMTKPRPQRYWYGSDLGDLTIVSRRAEEAMRVGDRVRLRNNTGVPVTRHGRSPDGQGTIEVDTLIVQETRTSVDVLWQDGTRETLDARETIPYLNPDEYDCWPGDHVLWKTEEKKQHVIVQSVNARDRTAYVRVVETGAIELASVLELDAHGTNDWSALAPTNDGLGVRRGDFVFIHKEGATNGVESPMVPRIGEVEEWVRESPTVSPNGQLGGWRRQMADIGTRIAEERGREGSVEEPPIRRPQKGDTSLNWFGEVIDLRLDGTVEIMLPNADVMVVPLNRLTRLYDSVEQLEDLWGDDEGTVDEGEEVEVWEMDQDGHWVEGTAEDDDEWESAEEDEDIVMEDAMDVDNVVGGGDWSPSTDTVIPPLHGTPISVGAIAAPDDSRPTSSNGRPHSPDVPKDAIEVDGEDESEEGSEKPWKRFEVLPSAPADHAFYNTSPAQPSRNFMARLTKEYKALQNSLPDSILVRAYEDRSDLLRSLIIGPENTPYEDAPFVIDWQLDSNFPQTPPIAHFLSWTNGNGRVNPNLYEEGKVCLSILGTWAGDKNESWSAARSSLLQAFVSIQGLVLVKEPWFCEPAYEKLRGTEDGIVNSRLYNEKAYVLSRGFVRRALEIPLGSLEAEINWFYYTNRKLKKVLDDAGALIEKSQRPEESETEADRERAVPRLSGGGIIALQRTLAKLQALYEAHSA